MLEKNIRSCDVCGTEIPKGQKYVVRKIPKQNAGLFEALTMARPEFAPTRVLDSEENVRLDICLECHMSMGTECTEVVN